jgi:hypothetical protein
MRDLFSTILEELYAPSPEALLIDRGVAIAGWAYVTLALSRQSI